MARNIDGSSQCSVVCLSVCLPVCVTLCLCDTVCVCVCVQWTAGRKDDTRRRRT